MPAHVLLSSNYTLFNKVYKHKTFLAFDKTCRSAHVPHAYTRFIQIRGSQRDGCVELTSKAEGEESQEESEEDSASEALAKFAFYQSCNSIALLLMSKKKTWDADHGRHLPLLLLLTLIRHMVDFGKGAMQINIDCKVCAQ